uniref:Uncharacterized protein n=2 Tax=Rhodnius prolixus TaxID=13249 RepID=T1IBZ9_RHOPR
MIKSLKEEKNIILQKLYEFVEKVTIKTSDVIEDLNKKQASNNNLLNLQNEVNKLKVEKEELEKKYNSAILLLKSDHESEVKKAQILLDELKQCCEAGCDVNALMNLRIELEEKHKLEVEELRTYFEQKCADMEKNYSEEIFSQHSRKHSASSSSSEEDLASERIFADYGTSGDNLEPEL